MVPSAYSCGADASIPETSLDVGNLEAERKGQEAEMVPSSDAAGVEELRVVIDKQHYIDLPQDGHEQTQIDAVKENAEEIKHMENGNMSNEPQMEVYTNENAMEPAINQVPLQSEHDTTPVPPKRLKQKKTTTLSHHKLHSGEMPAPTAKATDYNVSSDPVQEGYLNQIFESVD